jgi:glycosyltransferase involved in cell wall biosynthesis
MQLSIIVPCYNGVPFIPAFVGSIKALEIPENLQVEVLIVDNGSKDGSVKLLNEECANLSGIKCRILEYTEKQSSYAVRNYGVKQCKGSMLAFTDIDCVLPSNYLTQLQAKLSSHEPPFIVAGNVELFLSATPSVYEYYDFVFGFNMRSYVKELTGVTANAALPASTFQAAEGFDEVESGGDRAFFKRLVSQSVAYYYHEDVLVYHPCRDSYIALVKKAERVGRGHASYYSKQSLKTRIVRSASLIVSAFIQIHQFKIIRQKKAVIGQLPFSQQVLLIGLIFWIGFYSRLYTVGKTLFNTPKAI